MPKELHEISQFSTGTITTPSESDIPDDAASYSINVDPIAEDGVLKGISANTDKQYVNGGSPTNIDVDATVMSRINDSGTDHLIFFDDNDNKFKKHSNLLGATENSSNLSGSAETHTGVPTIETNNKELHIGMGSGASDKPRWAGIIGHGQFGGSVPSGVQIADAELKSPTLIPDFHKVLTDNTYIYGFEFKGSIIYKLKISDNTLVDKRQLVFANGNIPILTAGCMSDSNDTILVMDIQGQDADWATATTNKAHGSWLKISTNDLTVIKSGLVKLDNNDELPNGTGATIADEIGDDGGKWIITDILEISNKVWISGAAGNSTTPARGRNGHYIFAVPTTSFATSSDLTIITGGGTSAHNAGYALKDRGSNGNSDNTEKGYFRTSDTGATDEDIYFKIPRICLVAISGSTTTCGLIMNVFDYDGSGTTASDYHQTLDRTNMGVWDGSAVQGCATICIIHDEGNVSASDTGTKPPAYNSTNKGQIKILKTSAGNIKIYNSVAGVHETNTASAHGFMLLSNQDATVSTTSNLYFGEQLTYTSENISAHTNFTKNSYDIHHGVPLFIDNSDNVDIHMFAGTGNGRWMVATDEDVTSFSTNDFTIKLESSVEISIAETTYTNANFSSDKRYYFKCSFLYDGYQESPLGDATVLDSTGKGVEMTLKIHPQTAGHAEEISKRVTAVNLYMATSDDALYVPQGFYRFVRSFSFDDSWTSTSDLSGNPDWGTSYSKIFLVSGETTGSYESRTGISESLTNTIVHYGLSTQLNNHLFVADCHLPAIGAQEDVKNYIFRSEPYNYDQFNYAVNLLPLPAYPVALQAYMGRVYAFTENNTYRIEPNNLYIEDTLEGVGCVSKRSIYANDYGMCFANDSNIYLYNGRNVEAIGDPILRGDSIVSWQKRTTTYDPIVTFDSKTQSFLIFFKTSDNKYCCWSYHVLRRRWDLFSALDTLASSTSEINSAIVWTNGEVFLSEDSSKDLIHFMGHSSNTRAWDWYSKKLHMGQNTGDKKFKQVRIEGSPSGSLGTNCYVKVDGSNITETEAYSGAAMADFFVGANAGGTRGRSLQVFLSAQTGTVDAIGTVFRRFILLSKQS